MSTNPVPMFWTLEKRAPRVSPSRVSLRVVRLRSALNTSKRLSTRSSAFATLMASTAPNISPMKPGHATGSLPALPPVPLDPSSRQVDDDDDGGQRNEDAKGHQHVDPRHDDEGRR